MRSMHVGVSLAAAVVAVALAHVPLVARGPRATQAPAPPSAPVAWPASARMALSLSFDDGRASQVTQGLPVFARHGARVTLYVVPSAVEKAVDLWKQAAAAGHEIANHSLTHSCSGNFAFSRQKALEDHSIARMHEELATANRRIVELLGVPAPRSFAYPCGQTYVGRGRTTQSYVPVVAELFVSGRTWMDEAPNDPSYVDLAQATGIEMDGRDFADLRPVVEAARTAGAWLVLAGHDIGEGGRQTTRVAMLDALLAYAKDPANGIWLAPVGDVADHVVKARASR
jgi:peptidoglycan/xylan/chitin deacetylase (PgdA/CDA1 family)